PRLHFPLYIRGCQTALNRKVAGTKQYSNHFYTVVFFTREVTFLCIISLHVQDHPIYKLILIANRDEAYARPADSLHWWTDSPHLVGGNDSRAKGTRLGIIKHEYAAALANYRTPHERKPQSFSRGDFTRTFLEKDPPVANFLSKAQPNRQRYNGFNLSVGT